jgi:hypothetical protein
VCNLREDDLTPTPPRHPGHKERGTMKTNKISVYWSETLKKWVTIPTD